MSKSIAPAVCVLAVLAILHGDEPCAKTPWELASENIYRSQIVQLESQKLALEERKVYLASLRGSRITEEKAREISLSILKNLKDYPRGKKAKHMDEDVAFLVETIASIQKTNP